MGPCPVKNPEANFEDMPDYSPRYEREYDHDDDPDFGKSSEASQ